ncbi:hypothetical protein [Elioraea sp.]|uniref:hypothetical protein n=1 Tax=Elioraea sp. TaxID=2185103 RepID=UPI003F6E680D
MLDIYANHPDRLILTAEADAREALAELKAARDAGGTADELLDALCDRQQAADDVVFATKPVTLAGAAAVLRRVLCPQVGMGSGEVCAAEWRGAVGNVAEFLEAEAGARFWADKVRPLSVPLHRLGDALDNLVAASQALELAVDGIAAADYDTRAHGVVALACHLTTMAEAIAAVVGDRSPRWDVDRARLNVMEGPEDEAEGEAAAGDVA